MNEPTAWYRINSNGYAIFYELPPDPTGLIPMPDGWEEELETLQSELEEGWGIKLREDGHYEKVFNGIPEPPQEEIQEEPVSEMDAFFIDLASSVREGINSI